MEKFAIDGQQLSYLDQGQGPVIIFGHCYWWNSQMWAAQVEALSQSYRCIVPDFWGHGESEYAPSQTRTLKDYAEQILALMDHLNIENFSMVGLSMGGMWGTELALLAPSRITSLVLLDTFVGLEPEVMHKKYFHLFSQMTEQQAVPQTGIDEWAPKFFAHDVEQASPQLLQQLRDNLAALSGEDAVEMARIGRMVFGRREVIDEIEEMALPTLIICGQDDRLRTPLESYLMHDCITASQLKVVEKAGHMSNLEQPEAVNALLAAFLNQVHFA
ncbi:2-succinyl-6-hydroxy-2,4-cyclohexadiene-1-carboxylate synthase [Vibrio sp. 10N.286.49.B3]|uniref:alpha/beta fold hydrolase n=1 Tax=Vibrio sp. 10N.286.49.B3 TaxID=1880855 RepID=UPI000C863724|nr:alpha/beta hydrolase [Vibrio sp. 10N.286.49.B3]PMH39929.1 2-succinyl-6-hydroxy-2,4-cyclohexadiene-1-carboxylate synthase [Vibrio sp. 10N.286.49.B3]